MMAITTDFQRELERFGLISENMDSAFSLMDEDITEETNEEVDKALFEAAGVHLNGNRFLFLSNVELVNPITGKPYSKEELANQAMAESLPSVFVVCSSKQPYSFSVIWFTSFFFRFSSLSFIFLITLGRCRCLRPNASLFLPRDLPNLRECRVFLL